MVERTLNLDLLFYSLADATRRDILSRVAKEDLSISSFAKYYQMSFAAVAKHVEVLVKAHLVRKQRQGKQQIVTAVPESWEIARKCLDHYEHIWNQRFEALDNLLKNNP